MERLDGGEIQEAGLSQRKWFNVASLKEDISISCSLFLSIPLPLSLSLPPSIEINISF